MLVLLLLNFAAAIYLAVFCYLFYFSTEDQNIKAIAINIIAGVILQLSFLLASVIWRLKSQCKENKHEIENLHGKLKEQESSLDEYRSIDEIKHKLDDSLERTLAFFGAKAGTIYLPVDGQKNGVEDYLFFLCVKGNKSELYQNKWMPIDDLSNAGHAYLHNITIVAENAPANIDNIYSESIDVENVENIRNVNSRLTIPVVDIDNSIFGIFQALDFKCKMSEKKKERN